MNANKSGIASYNKSQMPHLAATKFACYPRKKTSQQVCNECCPNAFENEHSLVAGSVR